MLATYLKMVEEKSVLCDVFAKFFCKLDFLSNKELKKRRKRNSKSTL